jgi:hypothetical protein
LYGEAANFNEKENIIEHDLLTNPGMSGAPIMA